VPTYVRRWYRKSDSAIMVMKSAEDGRRYDAARVLDRAMHRSVLVERPMSPQLIIQRARGLLDDEIERLIRLYEAAEQSQR